LLAWILKQFQAVTFKEYTEPLPLDVNTLLSFGRDEREYHSLYHDNIDVFD